MVTTVFIMACLLVLAISLAAEHQNRKYTDTVVFTVCLMASLVACLVGEIFRKHYWPHDIKPMVAIAAATDATLSAIYIIRAVKSYALYKLILSFIGSSMCLIHVAFLVNGDFSRGAIHGWWFTANVTFALSLLIIGLQGGAVVCDLVRRRLSPVLRRGDPVGAHKARRSR